MVEHRARQSVAGGLEPEQVPRDSRTLAAAAAVLQKDEAGVGLEGAGGEDYFGGEEEGAPVPPREGPAWMMAGSRLRSRRVGVRIITPTPYTIVSDRDELDLGQNRKHEQRLFPWQGGAQCGEVVEVDAHAQRGLHGGAGEDGGGVAGGEDAEEAVAVAVLLSCSSRRLENTFSSSRWMNEAVNCKVPSHCLLLRWSLNSEGTN